MDRFWWRLTAAIVLGIIFIALAMTAPLWIQP
jgi:hypothetical protein